MSRPLRIGIVGCGGIAKAHADAARAVGATVAAVCDIARPAAELLAAKTGARVAASVEEMAQAKDLDAVSVCTPPALHLDCCLPFLKVRRPILCEKPLEVDLARAVRLASAVKKSRTLFMTAFCHRFHAPVAELRALIDRGVLGRPILFRNIFSGYMDLQGNHRLNRRLSGGGCLIDHCSHSVDLFRFLSGEPTHVSAQAGNVMQKLAVEDFGMVQLTCKNKVFGEITSSYSLSVGFNRIEWFGTKGTAVVTYWQAGQPDLIYQVAGSPEWVQPDYSGRPSRFEAEMRHFLECVRYRRKPSVTVDDGLAASRIAAGIYASIQSGRRIALKG